MVSVLLARPVQGKVFEVKSNIFDWVKLPAPATVQTQPDLMGFGDAEFPHVPKADWHPVPQ